MPCTYLGNEKLPSGSAFKFEEDTGVIVGGNRDGFEVFVAKFFVTKRADLPLWPAAGSVDGG